MGLLEQKRILVTGGSRGIGAAIVRMAMHEGADVAFIFNRSSGAASELSQQMIRLYPAQRCFAVQCDVADTSAMREAIRAITEQLGSIDALVNNAGITRDMALARMRREQWDEVISTNLGGVFNATQPLILQLVKQRNGSIINITSLAGVYGSNGQSNYAASKAGIIGFTKALSKELSAFRVRVNAVAPGLIETDMLSGLGQERLQAVKAQIPAGRFGTAEDVAHLVVFLASDRAAYITGQVIQIDGGLVF
jgi:3-oxoacyl-[acyl-carrier protein] reductase